MLEWGHKVAGLVPILLDGEQVAALDPEFWREGAELVIADQAWEFTRDGSDRIARRAGESAARLRARRPSFWSPSWVVDGQGVTYEVARASMFGSGHEIFRDGQLIGEGRQAGFWSSRASLDVDPSVPPVDQLFLLWISHIMRRRAAGAAAASS